MLNPKQVKISLTRACRGAYGEGVCAKPCQEDKPSSYAQGPIVDGDVVMALPVSGPRRREGRPGHGGHPPRHPGHPASVEVALCNLKFLAVDDPASALPAAEAAKARQKVVVMISRRTGYKALLALLWQRESRVASRWQSFGCWQLEPGRSALGHGLER
jgi:hypothetical protein